MRHDWQKIADGIYHDYQPIVSINSGETYGFEALLRGWQKFSFGSIEELFDAAHAQGQLNSLDRSLRTKAAQRFIDRGHGEYSRLFYNLDGRILEQNSSEAGDTPDTSFFHEIDPTLVCFELTEHRKLSYDCVIKIMNQCRQNNFRVALDDFGSGYAGLRLLYQAHPDIVKIDRFFISGIDTDAVKKIFVSKLVTMAHTLGMLVVAEGIESESEFLVSRDVGCDFAQGYFIQRPTNDPELLLPVYDIVTEIAKNDRRARNTTTDLLDAQISHATPVQTTTPVTDVLKIFRAASEICLLPVVNTRGEPMGVIREKDLKMYVYSPYGISILMNQASNNDLCSFIRKVPVFDIHTRIDTILNLYSSHLETDAVLITQNGKYCGLLDSHALLRVINEREIAQARDLNPLTKLPGNTVINEYISESLQKPETVRVYAYIDFNDFKPFNDLYGFRQGDRAILLFGEMLREFSAGMRGDAIAGHIGGDDFFFAVCTEAPDIDLVIDALRRLSEQFKTDVKSLYRSEHRSNGNIVATDRAGNTRQFPLLSVSTAVLVLQENTKPISLSAFGRRMATLKEASKKSECHFETEILGRRRSRVHQT